MTKRDDNTPAPVDNTPAREAKLVLGQPCVKVDMAKIKTLEDVIFIIEALDLYATVGTPAYDKLNRRGMLKHA